MKRVVIIFFLLLTALLYGSSPSPVYAQYNCTCTGDGGCTGTGCTTGSVGICGASPCSSITYQNVQYFCGPVECGSKCTYNASCRGPDDCACLSNGNCSDPVPGSGMNCSTGASLTCGTASCGSSYRPIQQVCTDGIRYQDCGYKCIYDQNCATGFCQTNIPPAPTPSIICTQTNGDFLCGSGGCNSCQRFIGATNCNGSQCQVLCSADATCGTGCAGGPGGATSTPGGGPTNTPGGPTNTPTLTPGPGTPSVTPTPIPGTILARAVQVDPSDTSCAAIKAVDPTNPEINGTVHQFTAGSASQPSALTQTNANYVQFTSLPIGSYTIDTVPPTADWALARYCWTNSTLSTSGESQAVTLGANQTIRFDIGYTYGTAWTQTGGGDVYASGNIRSYVPAVVPREFALVGDGGYPGVVTYGTTYDFDSDTLSEGSTIISSTNWNVNASSSTVNYYDYFYNRFGSPTTVDTAAPFNNLLAVTKPASRTDPYYVTGNMTTSGDWNVGDGENVIILVDGNLTIGGRINLTGTGFVAFIVNGNISVSSNVGTTAASVTPVLEGVYITSSTGTFSTGSSAAAATAKLVGQGVFVAGSFLLERDLDSYGGNAAAPAELFTYNPRLFFLLPDEMQELPITWQEVNP